MCNTYRNALSLVALLCLVCLAGTAYAESRWGNTRHSGYNGYYVPRPQPVFPTRPFFVQPYPRYQSRHHNYRHGYRDGYGDGYDNRSYRGDRWCPPGEGRNYSGYGDRHGWQGGYRQSPYYYPRAGVSFFYQSD